MKRFLLFLMTVCLYLTVTAQALAPMTWTAYGLTFNAPKGILVEEDTEDTFLLIVPVFTSLSTLLTRRVLKRMDWVNF